MSARKDIVIPESRHVSKVGPDLVSARSSDRTQFPIRPEKHGSRRGAVLLMILVIIVVLSAMIVQFTEKGMSEIAAEGHYVERSRLRITAFSALECSLAVLADVMAVDNGLTAPPQGWADPLGLSEFVPPENVKVSVSFADESGKLPLNSLDENTLVLLFSQMGFSADDCSRLAETLLDWIDTDDNARIDGAESDEYSDYEWPFAASNRPLRDLKELSVIEGFRTSFFDEAGRPNAYFKMFSDAVSTRATGTLNINSVSDLALRSYAVFGDDQISALRSYLAGPDGTPGTDDDRYFANTGEISRVLGQLPQGARLGVGVGVLRVHVEVSEGNALYALEAVVQTQSNGATGGSTNLGGGGTLTSRAGGAAARNTRNNSNRPTATPGGSSTTATTPSVPYPFVFLEMTEDVGHNDSIAAPSDDLAATAPLPPGKG